MKETKRYWKVKYGYSVADQVSIEEKELEKAIFAQIKKVPIQLANKYINGSNIIVIEPHYHKYTGWYDYYEPKDGDDWKQIERDCPSFDGWLEYYKTRVQYLMQNNRTQEIGKNVSLPELPEPTEKPKNEISEEVKKLSDKFKIL